MGVRLYVGNLSYDTQEQGLRQLVEGGGRSVADVHVVTDRETGRSRGFAFVELGESEELTKAISDLDGAMLDGRRLAVSEARPRGARGDGPPPPRSNHRPPEPAREHRRPRFDGPPSRPAGGPGGGGGFRGGGGGFSGGGGGGGGGFPSGGGGGGSFPSGGGGSPGFGGPPPAPGTAEEWGGKNEGRKRGKKKKERHSPEFDDGRPGGDRDRKRRRGNRGWGDDDY